MKQTTRMLAQQTRSAVVEPATIDEASRTVEVVWSTGATVRRYDWEDGCVYDEVLVVDDQSCDLTRLNNGAPVLNSHSNYDLSNVIGVVERAWIEGGEGKATIRLSSAEDDQAIWEKVRSGIIRNISVGYSIKSYEVDESGGTKIYRVTNWQPMEISLVPVGADAGAGTRAPENNQTPCNVVTKERTMLKIRSETDPAADPVDPAPTPAAVPPAPAANPAPADAPDTADTEQRAIAGEVTRLALSHKLPQDKAVQIASRSRTVAEARSAILQHLEERSIGVFGVVDSEHNRTTMDNPEARRAAMSDALLHRISPAATKLSDQARGYRHMSLLRMAEDVLSGEGIKVRGLPADQIAARALHSTSDFPSLMSNVMNKRLRQSYEENNPSYRLWARRAANAPDFKPIQATLLSNMPDLLPVNEHGEFKAGKLMDGKETYSVSTFGRIVGVTRQTLINDDLRALDRMMTGFASAAARLENRLVYAQLTANAALSDAIALFHASHGNLAASGSVISSTSLQAGRSAMRLQKGKQSEELNIAPRYLIVPTAQEQLAYQYTSSNYVPAKPSDVNEFRQGGRTALEPIVEAVLDASSSTAWYLAADSNAIDTVEYCYLDGAEGVFLDTQLGFDIDGMKAKARLDFATKVIDFPGLYKNPGA